MQVKYAIFVASHIKSSNQVHLLRKCLQSLCQQVIDEDIEYDVYLSISFEEQFIDTDIPFYSNLITVRQPKQMYQMEHLRELVPIAEDYTWILTCDDDDTYELDRVQAFHDEWINYLSKDQSAENVYAMVEFSDENAQNFISNQSLSPLAHWLYAIKSDVFIDFFRYFKQYPDLLSNLFSDLMLDYYLTTGQFSGRKVLVIKGERYNYNQSNQESVCKTIDNPTNRMMDIQSRLIRSVICKSASLFRDTLVLYDIGEDDVVDYVPNIDRFAKMAMVLYAKPHLLAH
jgi:hypothetical protein